jgi:hypothetical protein
MPDFRGDGRRIQLFYFARHAVRGGHDHIHLEAEQFVDGVGSPLEFSLGRAAVQDEVLPFNVARARRPCTNALAPGSESEGNMNGPPAAVAPPLVPVTAT